MVLGRWSRRGWVPGAAHTPVDPQTLAGLRATHLLMVPSTVPVELVDLLVRSRFPHTRLAADGTAQLGRLSSLSGPFVLSMEDAVAAGVPLPWTVVYALEAPVEREDPPLPGLDDRDGFGFAFPTGLPWREEGRGLRLVVALARRLQGAVRVGGGEVITPDPLRAIDYVVHSPFWLDPDVVRGVVARVLPSARLDIEGLQWEGPSEEAYTGALILPHVDHDQLSEHELDELHAVADANDLTVLAAQDVIDGYAVMAEISDGYDGALQVLVSLGDPNDPAVADVEWAQRPYVSYQVRWAPPDPQERETRVPTPAFAQRRDRVRGPVLAVVRAVVEATSGIVTDEDGFPVDRYTL